MSEFRDYQAVLNEHVDLQYRLTFNNRETIETAWKPTGDEEIPYRFIAGAVFDHRNQFVRRLYDPA